MELLNAFDDPTPDRVEPIRPEEALVLNLENFEGPLDVLLTLARTQKVDLAKISILQLAEQYLAFIAEVRKVRLELAADYLVMAAWLAYLKSKLLLPPEDTDEEESGPELAARLQFQLHRLEAMREASQKLLSRPLLGIDVFARGQPEGVRTIRRSVIDLSLYELLKAYGDFKSKGKATPLTYESVVRFTIEEALERLEAVLGKIPAWETLESFLPAEFRTPKERRAAMAATFSASLELAKRGSLRLRQTEAFGPIFVLSAGEAATAAAAPVVEG